MKKTILIVLGALFVANAAVAAPKAKAPKPTKELLEKGKATFTVNCVACHGEKGDGTGPAAVALDPKPRNFSTDQFKNGDKPDQVFKTISEGLAGTPMVAYGHLSEEERWGLVYYVLEFHKKAGKKK
ncbi:MAG: cytochrome c [Myxococcales bacterium]|nr:cytochrome c [Myxococcales bacterium]MCB9647722.1 cytochrome c [Deltaproteobacteria bacterium]